MAYGAGMGLIGGKETAKTNRGSYTYVVVYVRMYVVSFTTGSPGYVVVKGSRRAIAQRQSGGTFGDGRQMGGEVGGDIGGGDAHERRFRSSLAPAGSAKKTSSFVDDLRDAGYAKYLRSTYV